MDAADAGSEGYVLGGYPLGDYCLLALFDTSPPPPSPPPRFGHLGVSTALAPAIVFTPGEGGGSFLFNGVMKTVELNISPSFFETLTLEIWFKLNSYAGAMLPSGRWAICLLLDLFPPPAAEVVLVAPHLGFLMARRARPR